MAWATFLRGFASILKVCEAHCTEEATCKNSRNFSKVSALSFKEASIQLKNGFCDTNFRGHRPKKIGGKSSE